jgi:cyclopropane-fatty-acyl-phospholipid synthase
MLTGRFCSSTSAGVKPRPYPGTVTAARTLEALLGRDLPIAVRAYDGSRLGPADASATLLIRSPNVFRRLITAPGELGLSRACVSGEGLGPP